MGYIMTDGPGGLDMNRGAVACVAASALAYRKKKKSRRADNYLKTCAVPRPPRRRRRSRRSITLSSESTALQFLFHGDLNSVSRSIRDARGKERQMEYQHLICFDWRIEHPWCYVGSAFVFCVFVRAILSLFSAAQLSYIHKMSFMDGFCGAMIGWVDRHNRDEKIICVKGQYFLSSFVLGLMELLAFPILFATSLVTVIGVWIGFKAVAQWSTWKEQRFTFNRFLLGKCFGRHAVLRLIVVLRELPCLRG